MSPKMWQLAHDASPLPELWVASYRIGRPATTEVGSGLGIDTDWVSALVARLITLTELSNRVATNRRPLASSSTRPIGPPPVTGREFELIWRGSKVLLRSAVVSNTPTLLEPNAATNSLLPSAETTISVGVERLCCAAVASKPGCPASFV